ncbi:hypothetical protein K523DRAFT_368922 [Schizophyllum commune Tattone D]|nr:hypothetical protein K523DRAFT_368922 [Schizophyllum commune Tattone D]
MYLVKLVVFLLGFSGCLLGAGARRVNFDSCLANIRSVNISDPEVISSLGITDNYGNRISVDEALHNPRYDCDESDPLCFVTAISVAECNRSCGEGPEPFSWSTFSQQFGAWLLPWLALVSQLPFGARLRVDNLMSVVLAIGSPALAGYSLVFTVLNSHWLTKRFYPYRYPNLRLAVRALSSLQQSPLRVHTDGGLLASLVALHHNDEWWSELVHWLEYTHTWSISAVTNILWVVIAYVFTVINAFTEISQEINANGQANGSLWLWLLPIVVGWLQISPKCDADRLEKAMDHANGRAYVATETGIVGAKNMPFNSHRRALDFYKVGHGALYDDMHASAPIYNYARVFSWGRASETVAQAFGAASAKRKQQLPVARDGRDFQQPTKDVPRPRSNREGTRTDVEAYCYTGRPVPQWVPGVWTRMALSSIAGLALQWATTGSAVIIVWYTPTTGLGCRSGAYLLYGLVSTMVWFVMVLSSILAHYSTIPTETYHDEALPNISYELPMVVESSSSAFAPSSMESAKPERPYPTISATLAIALRRMGKLLATANACFVIVACVFQFSNFFNRCYCNSSVLAHGAAAYDVMELTDSDISDLKSAWTGGVVLATVMSAGYTFFVNIYINPQLPENDFPN